MGGGKLYLYKLPIFRSQQWWAQNKKEMKHRLVAPAQRAKPAREVLGKNGGGEREYGSVVAEEMGRNAEK